MGIANCCNNRKHEELEIITPTPDLNVKKNDSLSFTFRPTDSKATAAETGRESDLDNLIINNDLLVHGWKDTPLEKYMIKKVIGKGSYGKVFLVVHKETNIQRAMKEICLSSDSGVSLVVNEIDIIKKLDYPNIIKIYEFFQIENSYYLITEYCSQGELFKKIIKGFNFDESHICSILYQLLLTIYYCHINNIVHRDLKPENILIEGFNQNSHLNIKVIDFGTAKSFEKTELTSQAGSAYYIAPEVIMKKYNQKCDIWSIGVIMYVLIAREPPFKGVSVDEVFMKILNNRPNFNHSSFNKISSEGKDFIARLLEKDPTRRPSALEALYHSWFKKFGKEEKVGKDRIKLFVNNLKAYKNNYKLQQAAIAVIVHNMPSNEDIKELERAFRVIDFNGDGRLNKRELINGFMKLFNKTLEEAQEIINNIFKNVDSDKNGSIEYEEFIRACIKKESLLSDVYLKFAFDFFDRDQSGQITTKEIQEVFCSGNENISLKMIKKIVSEVDLDGDGQVSFDEFKSMMSKILD